MAKHMPQFFRNFLIMKDMRVTVSLLFFLLLRWIPRRKTETTRQIHRSGDMSCRRINFMAFAKKK